MPYKVTWTADGLELDAYGVVTLKDIIEAQGKFYGDARSESAKYVIWNSFGAEKFDMSTSEYVMPAGNDLGASYTVKTLRVALVATDPVVVELCVQYKALLLKHNTGWNIEIFEDIDLAKEWSYRGLDRKQA